jgi:hypothetical protein
MRSGVTPKQVQVAAGAFAALAGGAAGASFVASLGPVKYALSGLFLIGLAIVLIAALVDVREDTRREIRLAARRAHPLVIDISYIQPMRGYGAPPLIAFTLTNEAEDRVKVYSLTVHTATRQPAPSAQLRQAGAVPVTYRASVVVGAPGSTSEVLEQEHILEAGETEAYNVALNGPGGWHYDLRLTAEWAYIGESRQELIGPAFDIEVPARSAEELRQVLEELRKN